MADFGTTSKRPTATAHPPRTRLRPTRRGARARRASVNISDASDMAGTFACPFYRKDPFQYVDCVNYRLTRLSDVKQHLQRRHLDDLSMRCPICTEVFTSSSEREKHVKSSTCCINSTSLEPLSPNFEQSSQPMLKTRSSRGMTPSEMYFDLWDGLFGKDTRPLNPYLGPVFLETTATLRGLWETERSSILRSIISGKTPLWILDEQTLSTMLVDTFDQLQDRFEDRVTSQCSARMTNIPTSTDLLNKQRAGLDIGGDPTEQFDCYESLNLGLGIDEFDNQFSIPGCSTSVATRLFSQDPAASASNRAHYVSKNLENGEDNSLNGNKEYQTAREAPIERFPTSDFGSDFVFDLQQPFQF
ncbi:unnamed protein product [Clonostachys rosea]|uniref:C2H2-type domain-containing protein n=1 Tax=Bionectria ochroleuca TaxID=29856 RepID=A0ABY6TZ96_BIOOC|nr:unnamed protein product [Clonostachys rosea]